MKALTTYIKLLKKEKKKFPSASFLGLLKYYKAWTNSMQKNNTDMGDTPWMTFGAIDFLKATANKKMRVFEYGSGSSTLFWATRAKEIYSVEHDEAWAKNVQKELVSRNVSNVQLFFIQPEKRENGAEGSIADPYQYGSDDSSFRKYSFEKYVKKIDEYPDNYFDFVIVDGRSRPSCIGASISKVKKDGYLLVDNSEREYYFSQTKQMLPENQWKRMDFCGPIPGSKHFSQTTLFKRLS